VLELTCCHIQPLGPDILLVEMIPRIFMTAAHLVEVEEAMEQHYPGRRWYNIYVFTDGVEIDHFVKLWAADPKGNSRTLADAVVATDVRQRVVFDFYLQNYTPPVPTALFDTIELALAWIASLRRDKG
jgi:hypothetical protein